MDETIAIVTQEKDSMKKTKAQSVQFVASTSGIKDFKKQFHKGKHHFDDKKGKRTT